MEFEKSPPISHFLWLAFMSSRRWGCIVKLVITYYQYVLGNAYEFALRWVTQNFSDERSILFMTMDWSYQATSQCKLYDQCFNDVTIGHVDKRFISQVAVVELDTTCNIYCLDPNTVCHRVNLTFPYTSGKTAQNTPVPCYTVSMSSTKTHFMIGTTCLFGWLVCFYWEDWLNSRYAFFMLW